MAGFGRTKRILGHAGAQSIHEAETMQARVQSAFESQLAAAGMLGQQGTYDSPVSGGPGIGPGGITSPFASQGTSAVTGLLAAPTGASPGAGLQYQAGSIFKDKEVSDAAKFAGYAKFVEPSKVIDPEKFTQMVSQMPIARIVSRQVAEAQGLSDPSSPFRQSLEQSIKNPILEAGAETLRESQRFIKNQMAKGGSARRAALGDAQNMLAIEASNRQVAQQMWQSNLQFESWIRDYQRTTVNAAQAFTQGLGVQQYTNAMNQASQFMVSTALPAAANYQVQALQIMQSNKKAGVLELVIGGIIGVVGLVAAAYTGGATLGAAAGALGGVLGGGKSKDKTGVPGGGFAVAGPGGSGAVMYDSPPGVNVPGAPKEGGFLSGLFGGG